MKRSCIFLAFVFLCTFSNAQPQTAAVETKPLWQTKLSVAETDFIDFISKDRILVGTIDTSDFVRGPKPHEIMLLNAATGATIWAVPRGSFGLPQTLVAVSPVILIQGSKQYAALNPDTGAQIWSREQAGEQPLLLGSHGLVIFLDRKSSPLSLSAVDVKTGSEAWKTAVENYSQDKNTRLEVTNVGNSVVLNGPEVVALSAAEGKLQWRLPFPATYGPKAVMVPLGEDLYFSDGSAITRTDPVSGKQMWRVPVTDGELEVLTEGERDVFALLKGSGEDSPDSIMALDRADGKRLWKYDLLDRAASPMNVLGDRLYVTTPGNVIALDALKGELVFKTEIPERLGSRHQLPDQVQITSDRIIVAREDGVLAVQRADGKLLFADEAVGGEEFTYDRATHRFLHAVLSAVPRTGKQQEQLDPFAASPDENYRVAMAEQRVAIQRSTALHQGQAKMQAQMTVPLFMIREGTSYQTPYGERVYFAPRAAFAGYSAVAFLEAVGAIANQTTKQILSNTLEIYRTAVERTFESHSISLQGDFYVRPCSGSLFVVELETGKQADIPGAFAGRLPAFSTDGSRLVSKGPGVHPDVVETSKRVLLLAKVRQTTVYQSVIAYDLASVSFNQESPRQLSVAKPVGSAKRKLNEQLIAAAYRNDVDAVRRSLDGGADVNAANEYGETPLMMAAETAQAYNRIDVIELLLGRGADPNIKDAGGATAFAHSFLLVPPTSRTGEKAVKLLLPKANGETK